MVPAMRSREVRLVRRPVGVPVLDDFGIVETVVAEPVAGQALVRNRLMALGAVMRTLLDGKGPLPGYQVGQPLFGRAVGEVVASDTVPPATLVAHPAGWREYALVDAARVEVIEPGTEVGALSSGFVAYAALRAAGLRPGETVFVSSAAGAVGSTAAFVAKQLGAGRVIGSSGSAAKRAVLTTDYGYDAALDRESRPSGVDVALDLVGDPAVVTAMNTGGRIALVGALAEQFGEGSCPPLDVSSVIAKGLTLTGVTAAAHPELRAAYRAVAVEPPHTVVDGLDAAPSALLDLFAGRHRGLVLVSLG